MTESDNTIWVRPSKMQDIRNGARSLTVTVNSKMFQVGKIFRIGCLSDNQDDYIYGMCTSISPGPKANLAKVTFQQVLTATDLGQPLHAFNPGILEKEIGEHTHGVQTEIPDDLEPLGGDPEAFRGRVVPNHACTKGTRAEQSEAFKAYCKKCSQIVNEYHQEMLNPILEKALHIMGMYGSVMIKDGEALSPERFELTAEEKEFISGGHNNWEKQSDIIFTAVSTSSARNMKEAKEMVVFGYVPDEMFTAPAISHALKRLEKYYQDKEAELGPFWDDK